MLRLLSYKLSDKIYVTGLIAIVFSMVIFCLPSLAGGDSMHLFIVNFAIAVIYFFVLLLNGRFKKNARSIHTLFNFLILFLISAYSLNRELTIFEESANWFCIALILVSTNYLLFPYFRFFKPLARYSMSFLLGVSVWIFVYLGLYLVPYYLVGIAGFFLLGISLHVFVPLLFVIYTLVLVRRSIAIKRGYLFSFIAGIGAVAILLAYVVSQWLGLTNTVNREYRQAIVNSGQSDLPAWVNVSQTLPKGWLSERLLKTSLVYSVPGTGGDFIFRMPSMNFGENHRHDPLVMIGSMVAGRVNIPNDEKIKILKAMYDARHEAEERLWSGENLSTSYVNTKVNVWPEYRMAYTEQVITVSNDKNNTSWGRSEEAIYTFNLPEGSVVTSLSLWIKGKEQKGILTSKSKAATAYKTIVGVESRDPSIVQWKEGNRVTVRVFPVLPNESRIFKIGITSPLIKNEKDLAYKSIYFDGPSAAHADEDIKLWVSKKEKAFTDHDFTTDKSNNLNYNGDYQNDWTARFMLQPLSEDEFAFNGNAYKVSELNNELVPQSLNEVFLDINASWTEEDIVMVMNSCTNKQVFVYTDDKLVKLNDQNAIVIAAPLLQQRFSIFPLYLVTHPERSVIITKGSAETPNLDDLKESSFTSKLVSHAQQSKPVCIFNLGSEVSPYLKSLRELRLIRYTKGSHSDLNNALTKNIYPVYPENESTVALHDAGMKIEKNKDSLAISAAPDHLLRLFAYNHVLQTRGQQLLYNNEPDDETLGAAEEANIVTPFTSLVVLESQEDYDRFDIKKSKDSLGNASANSTGAVPEPHEWALIILTFLTLLYSRFKKNIAVFNSSK